MHLARRAAVSVVWCLAVWGLALGPAGCRGRAAGVPGAAKFFKAGKRVAYTAPSGGTVFVVDDWYNRLVYSGPVKQGDEVVVDARSNVLTVAGERVAGDKKLTEAEHSVWVDTNGAARTP